MTVKRYGSAKTSEPVLSTPPPSNDPFAWVENKYRHYNLKYDDAEKMGLKRTGDRMLSIRLRADGKRDYFWNSTLLRVDSVAGNTVHLTDTSMTDPEMAPFAMEVSDESVRVTHTIEYSDPSKARVMPDGHTSYFFKMPETVTLPYVPGLKAGTMIEAANPETPEDLQKLKQMFGEQPK